MKQTEFIGRGTIDNLPGVLESHGVDRVFLVSGAGAYHSSGLDGIVDRLLGNKVAVRFHDFTINAKYDDAVRGMRLFQNLGCDIIVAIGGGTVIDIAKLINVFQCLPNRTMELATGQIKVENPGVPLVAVPTTAGTGSEATHFAVVYVEGTKYSVAHPHVLPDTAIVDSRLTDNLPPYITACTGFDALCHATESFWAVGSTPTSQEYATEAIELLRCTIVGAVNEPSNPSRDVMIRAANLAGKAINISKTTAPHAISYPITSDFGVPHGHAVAVTLGWFFEINTRVTSTTVNDPRGADYVRDTMTRLWRLFDVGSAQECRLAWYERMSACGLEYRPSRLGMRLRTHINNIIANVNLERLGNHPVTLSPKQIPGIFQKLEG
jgi:alcohol dehydrogenase class IV